MATTPVIRYKSDLNMNWVVEDVLKQRPGWSKVDDKDTNWDLYWCDLMSVRNVPSLKSHQKVSHFRNFYELSRKNYLVRNFKRYKRKCVKDGNLEEAALTDVLPMTFEIPAEMTMFVQEARSNPDQMWIVKPASSCRGRGIFIFKKMSQFEDWRNSMDWTPKERQRGDNPEDVELVSEVWVVQKYISNPYLWGGKKFDIRMYVLVTSFSPLTVWIARDGFARFSGLQYCNDNFSDRYAHLTNTSIQLSNKDKTQVGHKWDIQNLRHLLSAIHGREIVDKVFQNIAQVVLTSLNTVDKIMVSNSKNYFELYGYDILLKDDLSVVLLEINAGPSLAATDEHDYKLKYNLIEDVLNVVDVEQRLTGKEIRVGGFDKVWCNGPLYQISKGINIPEFCKTSHLYNMYLGCINDREEQLKEMYMWTKLLKNKSMNYESKEGKFQTEEKKKKSG